MDVVLVILAVSAILVVIDAIKDLELQALLVFLSIFLSIIYGDWRYLLSIFTIFFKPLIQLMLFMRNFKHRDLWVVAKPMVYIALYVVIGIALGIIAPFVILPPLDPWTSRLLYILLIFLVLSLTANPSLEHLSTLGLKLMLSIETLHKILLTSSIVLGIPLTLYIALIMKQYTILPISLSIAALALKRRLGVYGVHVALMILYASLIVLTTLLGI